MEIRCGDCATVLPPEAVQCPTCGRMLGSAPVQRSRPMLFIWAAAAAAVEVALTLAIMRACHG